MSHYDDYKKEDNQSILRKVLTQDEHMKCARFHKSRVACCSDKCLLIYRICYFIPMFFVASINTYQNWRASIYFESEWGFIFSLFSIFCSIMAHYSTWFHSAAVVTSEIAMALNIAITIIFWGVLVPIIVAAIYAAYEKAYKDAAAGHPDPAPTPTTPATGFLAFTSSTQWLVFEMCFVHSSPIINSIIELKVTDMVFLKRDSKWCFLAGFIYMFCNYWGYSDVLNDTAVYPIPWLNWPKGEHWKSWLGYGLQAPAFYGFNYCVASWVQSDRGYVEGEEIGPDGFKNNTENSGSKITPEANNIA